MCFLLLFFTFSSRKECNFPFSSSNSKELYSLMCVCYPVSSRQRNEINVTWLPWPSQYIKILQKYFKKGISQWEVSYKTSVLLSWPKPLQNTSEWAHSCKKACNFIKMNLQAFSRAIDHSCRTNTLQTRFSRTQSLIEHFSMITSEKKKKKSNIFAFPYHTIYFLGNEGPIWIKC